MFASRFSAAPHAPYTVCDANLTRVKEFADANGLPVHIHLHETHSEVADSESGIVALTVACLSKLTSYVPLTFTFPSTPLFVFALFSSFPPSLRRPGNKTAMACHRSDTPARPFSNLDRLGLVDERLIAVHMTQLSADEIARCGEARVNVVHCPSSNLKLASGMCPIARLHAAGANVCIGTDSTASNNTLDMWGEMRLAALLAKAVSADPTAVPALTALRMATINGARALGLGDRCGSLEVGKACDVIAVDLSAAEFVPVYDVVSHLVYCADRRAVTDVWCAGARLMRNRRLVTVNEAEIVRAAREWQTKIAAHRDEAARAANEAASAAAGAAAGAPDESSGQEAAAPASEAAAADEK